MSVFGWSHFGRFAEKRKLLSIVSGACVALSGCATSLRVPSFSAEVTGSIAAPASPLSPSLDPEDWRRAKGAMGLALDPQGNGAPVSWDNPQTGARGGFTPAGAAYARDDKICRAFTAELSGAASAAKLQGTACRDSSGDWTIGALHPSKS
jgi:surface antigen